MPDINRAKLLWALNMVEGSGKERVKARHEPRFYDRYLKGNKEFIEDEREYGHQAIASSYGPWQIMYSTAKQHGFNSKPTDLSDPAVSLKFVNKHIDSLNRRFKGDVRKIISAYNAGAGGVGSNPDYTDKVMGFYEVAPNFWKIYGTGEETKGESLLVGKGVGINVGAEAKKEEIAV